MSVKMLKKKCYSVIPPFKNHVTDSYIYVLWNNTLISDLGGFDNDLDFQMTLTWPN